MVTEAQIAQFLLETQKSGYGTIGGISMSPVLPIGYKVKIEQVSPEHIEAGDVVVFASDSFCCHRVISKMKVFRRTYFIHKGDNSRYGGIFSENELVGKVMKAWDAEGKEHLVLKQRVMYRPRLIWHHAIYIIAYLLKKRLFGKKTNSISCFVNGFYWNYLN
jgi:signal peptidase I